MFGLMAAHLSDRREFVFVSVFYIRSLTPQQAKGNALAVAVQPNGRL
jgi:hypothetical protein